MPSSFNNSMSFCSVVLLINSVELKTVSIVPSIVLFGVSVVLSMVLGSYLDPT